MCRKDLNSFAKRMNVTCLEDGKIEELPIGIFIKVFGILSYFLSNLGHILLLGIVHYEKFGRDPQKRSLPDQIFSFNMVLGVILSIILSNIIIVRTLFGPIGNAITQLRYYLITSMYSIILGSTETMLFRCLMIFSWKKYAMVNDEFFATFLNIYNLMIGQIICIICFYIGNFSLHNGYQMFSGYCTNVKDGEM